MSEPVETLDGWYSLHDFRTIDWTAWKLAAPEEREAALHELKQLFEKWESVEERKDGSSGIYSIVGQKADLLFWNLRPTMEELNKLENELNKTKFAEFTLPAYSYVSVVELSNYMNQGKDPDTDPEIQARLKPILPKWDPYLFLPNGQAPHG